MGNKIYEPSLRFLAAERPFVPLQFSSQSGAKIKKMKILRQFCLFGLTAFTLRACEGQKVVRRPAYEWLHLLHDLMGVHIIAPRAQDAPVSTNALIILALTPCRPFQGGERTFSVFPSCWLFLASAGKPGRCCC